MGSDLRLRYGSVNVGDIGDAFCHQGTWFGTFQRKISGKCGPVEQRLCDFITFCEEWHARLRAGGVPDALEFDKFSDLLGSGLWQIEAPDGSLTPIEEAPVFAEGEVSWHSA
jgi:hypothetical protein